jgi:hypothetical protein
LDFLDLELDLDLSASFTLHNVAAYKAMNFCITTPQNLPAYTANSTSEPQTPVLKNGASASMPMVLVFLQVCLISKF